MRLQKNGLLVVALLFIALQLQAQYFGRNKASYESFDFEVVQTPNFEIYHYLKNEEVLRQLASTSEQWYQLHQNILKDTIYQKNPVIFYNDHADFQQTNAISGAVGVGTGGVTEAFKNRVIMPIAMSNQQTHHVLGHELVHAFQYNMILRGDSTSLRSLGNIPLWMTEGLAEYLSIGSVDAHTAMWMRDAVLQGDIPSIEDLNNPKYFPYRYGQAFWAFLTGLKGDGVIAPFYETTAKVGLEQASVRVLGVKLDKLSELWQGALKKQYTPFLGEERSYGKAILNKENAGRINISPAVSPNGRYVIFLSEKDLFSIDVFLANARTGKIIRKVASTVRDGHLDAFNFIESAGTWSPNSREFAFVAFKKGKNVLVIKNALEGKTVAEFPIKGVPAFSNPAWSPDGKTIVVTGLADGQHDLYAVDVKTKKVKQLTDDVYSEIHPHWSADGTTVLFSSDQRSFENGRTNGRWTFNLAELDMVNGAIRHYDIFPGADNLNPLYDINGNILFLSNRDGFRNLYRLDLTTGQVFKMTDFLTGISGITHYAPAISIARKRDRIAYTYYAKNGYSIHQGATEDFISEEVDPQAVDFTAATLPQLNPKAPKIVDAQLAQFDELEDGSVVALRKVPYQSKFKLDYVGGGAGVGVGNSAQFGTQSAVAGGIDLLFSDILGDNQFFTSLRMNGELADIGGSVAYINRKKQINWGSSISHIPFRSTQAFYMGQKVLPVSETEGILTDHYQFIQTRVFEDRASVFAQYPLSTTLRFEGSAAFTRYGFRVDTIDQYYTFGGLIDENRSRGDAPDAIHMGSAELAIVGDNSYFGLTAPLEGYRFRVGVEQFIGDFNYLTTTADYRIYRFYKPIGFAFRAMHYGRYGRDANQFFPLYIGSPWFIRGYNSGTTQEIFNRNGDSFNLLFGSKMLVTNFEIRIPFSGPKQLALINSKFLFTDLNFFVDGGLAFDEFEQLGELNDTIKPVFSAGVSARINLFGAMVLEPYYAWPIQQNTKAVFGMNIIPGW
jgi:hypothetical protein